MQSATCLSTITIARYDVIITILTILVLFSLAMGWVCACFLVRNQAIDRMAFLKRRAIPIAALTLITFALGWVCACFRAQVSADERIAYFKLDLTQPNVSGGVLDAPMTEFQISVPELDIDKKLSILSPKSDLKHYPDMIEFQLIAALENEIQSFVPKDDPFWK